MRASIILSSTIAGGPGWLAGKIGNAVSIIVFLEFTGRIGCTTLRKIEIGRESQPSRM
jgi:hypothetical protein